MNSLRRVSIQVIGQRRDPKINVFSWGGFSVGHQKIQPFLFLASVIQMENAEIESHSHAGKWSSYLLLLLAHFLKVKAPSARVISKVQLQPGVWVRTGMSTHKLTWTAHDKLLGLRVLKTGGKVSLQYCFQGLSRHEFIAGFF